MPVTTWQPASKPPKFKPDFGRKDWINMNEGAERQRIAGLFGLTLEEVDA